MIELTGLVSKEYAALLETANMDALLKSDVSLKTDSVGELFKSEEVTPENASAVATITVELVFEDDYAEDFAFVKSYLKTSIPFITKAKIGYGLNVTSIINDQPSEERDGRIYVPVIIGIAVTKTTNEDVDVDIIKINDFELYDLIKAIIESLLLVRYSKEMSFGVETKSELIENLSNNPGKEIAELYNTDDAAKWIKYAEGEEYAYYKAYDSTVE